MLHADPTAAALAALALAAGHHIGDRWLQSDHQAQTKGRCGHTGRMACAGHVATLTATQLAMLAMVATVTGLAIHPAAAALGLATNAASHYWADRRSTLRGLVLAMDPLTGKRTYYEHGGAEHLDQAFHAAWIVPAALIAASPWPLAAALTTGGAVLLALADLVSRRALRAEDRAAA